MDEHITIEDIKRAADASKPVPKEIGLHVQLSTLEMDYDRGMLTTTQKWAAMLIDAAGKKLDKSLGEEILAKARAEGITDLCVLDAGFCLDAVKEAVARRLAGEMPCMEHCGLTLGICGGNRGVQPCERAKEWLVRYRKALATLKHKGLV